MPLFFFVFFARPLMSFFCLLQLRVVNSSRSYASDLNSPAQRVRHPKSMLTLLHRSCNFLTMASKLGRTSIGSRESLCPSKSLSYWEHVYHLQWLSSLLLRTYSLLCGFRLYSSTGRVGGPHTHRELLSPPKRPWLARCEASCCKIMLG